MFKRIILGQLRHLLSVGGGGVAGYLIAQGAALQDVEVIAAGLVAAVSAGLSILDKYEKEEKELNR